MPSRRDRLRTLVENGASLTCVLLAGWALACMQSGRAMTAEVLAAIAASIPLVALLLRVPAYVAQAARGWSGTRSPGITPARPR